jgi:cold shock CspA family protein|tara:strand:- start:2276 stop:2665 length:390 start_codon:yes stop_codon:yes gene_type:complete
MQREETEQSRTHDEPLVTGEYGSYTGNCKWFNNKIGYGFVTVMDGEHKGKDIFVHHSGVCPKNSNFKTLTKGEYVSLSVTNGKNGLQAVDVTGVLGGPLMCDNVILHRPKQFYNNTQAFNSDGGGNMTS